MSDYYSDKLSAERLRQCYQLAPPRIRQYLQAEIDYVVSLIKPGSSVLELGCGYGRVLQPLAAVAETIIGIDTSLASLKLAHLQLGATNDNCLVAGMSADRLGLGDDLFDMVVCIQNGISAFHVDQRSLIVESLRVTKPGGLVLFSSYSDQIWNDRLNWFELQSEASLLGEIDYEKTGSGTIVCRDGFKATTVTREGFEILVTGLPVRAEYVEIDASSLFCCLHKL